MKSEADSVRGQTFSLSKGSTKLTLADPRFRNPYYRGTRFDRGGIILSIKSGGHSYVSQWFREYDPFRHDAVGGPAEEFTQTGYGESEEFLKTGVGILRAEDGEYDRFRLYEVIDPGEWTVVKQKDKACFRHLLAHGDYGYEYSKTISIIKDGHIRIGHFLRNEGKDVLDLYVYNHNFFVLDGASTGRDTVFRLPFSPRGHWREDYDCVRLTRDGIVFDRNLGMEEKVFMGDLGGEAPEKNYSFTLENLSNGLKVDVSSDASMEYAVFWANHEVACLEPYTPLHILPGDSAVWDIDYIFSRK